MNSLFLTSCFCFALICTFTCPFLLQKQRKWSGGTDFLTVDLHVELVFKYTYLIKISPCAISSSCLHSNLLCHLLQLLWKWMHVFLLIQPTTLFPRQQHHPLGMGNKSVPIFSHLLSRLPGDSPLYQKGGRDRAHQLVTCMDCFQSVIVLDSRPQPAKNKFRLEH